MQVNINLNQIKKNKETKHISFDVRASTYSHYQSILKKFNLKGIEFIEQVIESIYSQQVKPDEGNND